MAQTTHGGARSAGSGAEGGGAKEQAQQKAQEVKDQAKEQAQQAAGQARGRLRDQVDQRSTQAGEQVARQAGDLRSVSEQLRQQGKDGPAKAVERVAERTERVGSWLTESDGERILEDIEDFARRSPWVVVAGGVALGFTASRLLKASSSRRYQQRGGGGLPPAGPTAARTTTPPAIDEPLAGRITGTAVGEPAMGTGPTVPPTGREGRS